MTSPNLEPALLWARRGAKARPRRGGQRGDMRRLIFLSALFILGAGSAFADDYPTRPIRLIVPFAPGGAVDPIARLIANPLGERLGEPIAIYDRGGAGGRMRIIVRTDEA